MAARHGTELLKQGKANISLTVDLLIYFPIKVSAITVYTFTMPIQIETEIPVDILKRQEEVKRQIEGAASGILEESQKRIKEKLPAAPSETTPTPVTTLQKEIPIPSPTALPTFPRILPGR